MYRLIYTSVARTPFDPKDLKRLVVRSQVRNAAADVTGALVYRSGRFLQALEGDMSAVMTTLGRIQADPRHSDITILDHERNLARRSFDRWSMAFSDLEAFQRGRALPDFSVKSLRKVNLVEFLLNCQRTRPASAT